MSYNRRVLPQLVEASLWTSVNSEIAPIEENLRGILGDLIRSCQATVFQNYQRLSGNPGTSFDPPSTAAGTQTPINNECDRQSAQDTDPARGSTSLFFQEPPYLHDSTDGVSDQLIGGSLELYPTRSHGSDSGYGSVPTGCECDCHKMGGNQPNRGIGSTSRSNTGGCEDACQMCLPVHSDPPLLVEADNRDDAFKDYDFDKDLNTFLNL